MGLVINIDKIEKIYIHKAIQAKYVNYIESKPEKRNFFGWVKQKEVKTHWCDRYNRKYDTREDLINKYCSNKYYINHEVLYENSIWEKASLYIVMSHSDNVIVCYDSDEELQEKLNDIISESKRNLMIINE